GIHLSGSGATGNLVEGNFIGTDPSGVVAMGNSFDGLRLDPGAANNTIRNNVISATHFDDGIVMGGSGTTGNLIVGNSIGTDRTGTLDLHNGRYGVYVSNDGNT